MPTFIGSRGRIFHDSWQPDGAVRGTIVLLHGYGEHLDPRYVHALQHDPLTWKGGFRRETLLAVRAVWPEVAAGLAQARPALPVLLVHGGADPSCP